MKIDNCLCGAKMTIASVNRGYETYRCSRGCNFYQYDETKEMKPDGVQKEGEEGQVSE